MTCGGDEIVVSVPARCRSARRAGGLRLHRSPRIPMRGSSYDCRMTAAADRSTTSRRRCPVTPGLAEAVRPRRWTSRSSWSSTGTASDARSASANPSACCGPRRRRARHRAWVADHDQRGLVLGHQSPPPPCSSPGRLPDVHGPDRHRHAGGRGRRPPRRSARRRDRAQDASRARRGPSPATLRGRGAPGARAGMPPSASATRIGVPCRRRSRGCPCRRPRRRSRPPRPRAARAP